MVVFMVVVVRVAVDVSTGLLVGVIVLWVRGERGE